MPPGIPTNPFFETNPDGTLKNPNGGGYLGPRTPLDPLIGVIANPGGQQHIPQPNAATLGSGGAWGNLGNRRAAEVSRRQAPTSAWEADQRYLGDTLRRQMSGQDSISREQLRQDSGRNIAMQQALAASAGPQNAAMAQRMAAQNAGRIGQGLAGQTAMAGIAERNAAAQALGGLAGQARDQDQYGHFSQQSANDAAWQQAQNMGLSAAQSQLAADSEYERQRQAAALAQASQPTNMDKAISGGVSALSLYNKMYPPTPAAGPINPYTGKPS